MKKRYLSAIYRDWQLARRFDIPSGAEVKMIIHAMAMLAAGSA